MTEQTFIIMELIRISSVDYLKCGHFLNACASKKSTLTPSMSKAELKELLFHLAQSDKKRELVRYTASGLTKTGARKHFGFENLQ